MAKAKGLGRGLDALLGADDSAPRAAGERLDEIALDLIDPGKYQPRTYMDEAALGTLAASIKTQGMVQPILVRPAGAGRYEIIAGERRWRAARLAGLTAVPAQVRVVADNAALAMALIENIQREDLNAIEEANGIQRLINEFGMTHDAAAQAVGRSRAAVTNLLRLLALPDVVRDMLQRSELDMGHARALLALPRLQQIELARQIAAHGMSVRETERWVAARLQGGHSKRKQIQAKDRDVLRLQEDLSQKLGTKVVIKERGNGRGTLQIDYTSLAQLDGVLRRLK